MKNLKRIGEESSNYEKDLLKDNQMSAIKGGHYEVSSNTYVLINGDHYDDTNKRYCPGLRLPVEE